MLPRPPMQTILNKVLFKMPVVLVSLALLCGCKPPGPKALFDGKRLLEKGKTDAAIERLQTATELMRTNAHAWNYLGIAYHQAGQASNAVVSYQRALAIDPDLSEVRLNLGSLWLEYGRLADAKTEFTAYNLRRPKAPEGFKQLAVAEYRGRETAAADSHIRKALQLDDSDPDTWNSLGLIQIQAGRLRDADVSFEAALKQDAHFAPALINLAVLRHQQLGDRSGALELYRRYVKLKPTPDDAEAVEQVILQIEAELRPPAKASPPIQQIPAISQQEKASVAEALSRPSIGDSPAAAPPDRINTVVAESPVKPAPQLTATVRPSEPPRPATAAQREYLRPESEPITSAAVPSLTEKVPLTSSRIDIGAAETVRSTTASAAKEVSVISESRRAAEQYAAKGAVALAARRYVEATDAYRAAANADPRWYQAQLNYAAAAFESGRTSEALAAGQRALLLRPDSTAARYNLALAYKQAGRLTEAKSELEQVVAARPHEARAHLTLGNLLANDLRLTQEARQHYLRVIELEPGHPQAGAIHFWLKENAGK